MKLRLIRISEGEEEIVIRYREMNSHLQSIVALARGAEPKIRAVWEGREIFLLPEEVYYFENVDGVTYAYLVDKVVRVGESLREITLTYEDRGFFRCSKSMVLNIHRISYLKSEPGNRIRATMENKEQVMISRKYAKELRKVLKGGADEEER
ncbi:LytTR family DNA-binding domain-containing protein [Roseburia hominis]